MSGNYLEDIDNFISKLGPPDQLLISRFEVGCTVCEPNYVVGRNFNTKAKLVNHFKSSSHAINVENAEDKKEGLINTVEENLFKINEEIKSLEEQIAKDTAQIRVTETETIKYKQSLLSKSNHDSEINNTKKQEETKDTYQCPKCTFKTKKLKRFKKHLHTHTDSSCQMLALKLA